MVTTQQAMALIAYQVVADLIVQVGRDMDEAPNEARFGYEEALSTLVGTHEMIEGQYDIGSMIPED